MKKSTSIFAMLGIVLAFGALAPAHATPIVQTINLDTVFTGNIPDGNKGPWLTAVFTQTGSNTGTLELISNLEDSDFLQGQNGINTITGWSFFLNQALSNVTCKTQGACGGSFSTDSINKAGPVTGPFNLTFGWPQNDRFDGTDTEFYTLTFAQDLNGAPIGATNQWWSVAHVQGIGTRGKCSGWIVVGDGGGADGGVVCPGTTPPTSVPEPADLGMFGVGVLMIGLFLGLRRRMA